jgi:hypothetical protein
MKKNKQDTKLVTQNHFSKFLLYTTPNGKVKVEIFIRNENLWLTQVKLAELFGVERSVVTKHLKNIFADSELDENSVCAKFAHTADDGKTYQTNFYNIVDYRNIVKNFEFRWDSDYFKNEYIQIDEILKNAKSINK